MRLVTPLEYLQVTGRTYQDIADRSGYSYDAVRRWFAQGKRKRACPTVVCRLLALELELEEIKRGQQ